MGFYWNELNKGFEMGEGLEVLLSGTVVADAVAGGFASSDHADIKVSLDVDGSRGKNRLDWIVRIEAKGECGSVLRGCKKGQTVKVCGMLQAHTATGYAIKADSLRVCSDAEAMQPPSVVARGRLSCDPVISTANDGSIQFQGEMCVELVRTRFDLGWSATLIAKDISAHAMAQIKKAERVTITGDLKAELGQDEQGAIKLRHVIDVDRVFNANAAIQGGWR